MLLLAASLLLVEPAPLEMPRAQAYLVKENGVSRLEDRFVRGDLWFSQTVDGRWTDAEGRVFSVSTLATRPPARGAEEAVSRADHAQASVSLDRKKLKQVREAVAALSPIVIPEKPARPRQLPRGFDDVDYWQGTNASTVVCAFLPEKSEVWRLAIWSLVEGDDLATAIKVFEEEYLAKGEFARAPSLARGPASERELLRRDAEHSVAAYARWHATDSDAFVVLDDIAGHRDFIAAVTNDLRTLQADCARVLPTPLDGSNALCVARIFANREEYQEALMLEDLTNLLWSAAYWCSERRELVAYLPASGEDGLLRTIRHEAFHQYLSYATAMIEASPWLNEGYAQYFEDPASEAWGEDFGVLTPEALERLSSCLPGLFAMDYREFYDGSDDARRLKYRLAWSVAVFLEKGAPKVRFDPFANLKRDYFAELIASHDMRRASAAVFGNEDRLKLFRREWLRWWKEHAR